MFNQESIILEKFNLRFTIFLASALLLASHTSTAQTSQTKVVVITLEGDPEPLTPTAPVANVGTSPGDYTAGTFTVLDNITGLEWQREDDDTQRTWEESLQYCATLSLNGYGYWRLPSVLELQSIIDYGAATGPSIEVTSFPNTKLDFYWTADLFPGSLISHTAVNFHSQFVSILSYSNPIEFYVRCVR